jgi:hypothetical protein
MGLLRFLRQGRRVGLDVEDTHAHSRNRPHPTNLPHLVRPRKPAMARGAGNGKHRTPPASRLPGTFSRHLTSIKESKAAAVLARYHANTRDERDPLVVFELAQIRHALRMEKEYSQSTSFSTLWATPGNRKRMMIIIAIALFSQWRYVVCSPLDSFPR